MLRRRPLARRPVGRGGLLGTMARTAVVAGTATAVVGGVQRHQQGKADQAYEQQQYEAAESEAAMQQAAQQAAQQQAASASPPPAPVAAEDNTIAELERLAALQQQGVLTDAEFSAAKARLLGI